MLPSLRLGDYLALSQTCRLLRGLVQTGVPPRTWAAVSSVVQPGASSEACYQRVRRLEASHARLRRGQPRATTRLSLPWRGARRGDPEVVGAARERIYGAEARPGGTPSPDGSLLASLHNDVLQASNSAVLAGQAPWLAPLTLCLCLQVHAVEPGPQLRLLFSLPSPETSHTARPSVLHAYWAPDSSQLALVFYLDDRRADRGPGTWISSSYNRIYLVRAALAALLGLAFWG